MVTQGNKHRRCDAPELAVQNLAYVSTRDLKFSDGFARKFVPKLIGPYPITAAFPHSNFEVVLPPHLRVHRHFHASKLRPHFPNDDQRFPSRKFDKPPPEVDAEDGSAGEYIIEKVVAHKLVGKTRHFLVRRLGFSSSEDQWLAEVDLRKNASESIDDYVTLVVARAEVAARARPLAQRQASRPSGAPFFLNDPYSLAFWRGGCKDCTAKSPLVHLQVAC